MVSGAYGERCADGKGTGRYSLGVNLSHIFRNGNVLDIQVIAPKIWAKLAASNTFLTAPKSHLCSVREV